MIGGLPSIEGWAEVRQDGWKGCRGRLSGVLDGRRGGYDTLMFTGLVEERGIVTSLQREGTRKTLRWVRLEVKAPEVAKEVAVGDSVAVSGCCLTVVKKQRQHLTFEAGSETLSRTTLGRLEEGSLVNLERALRLQDRLGGHFVTGHVDGLGTLLRRRDEGSWSHFTIRCSARLTRQMASKGSVAVDGVSLTLVNVENDWFSVALIPYTLEHTTLGTLQVGQVVNIETDLLAKYVERQLESWPSFRSLAVLQP